MQSSNATFSFDAVSRLTRWARSSLFANETVRSKAITWRARHRLRRQEFQVPDRLASTQLVRSWWYYTVELLPGILTLGQYPPDLPMLPRMMLRRCSLEGMACLDLGSMEGLIPALMCRGGAGEVVATDFSSFCLEKLEAVRHYYGVDFSFRSVGLMYDLHRKFGGRSFDLINCSGLLYHVFSPLTMLAGLRPLLKRNGLLIVSTNVVLDHGHFMEFNNAGRMQVESNTFWYPSISLLDYLLRYLRLRPIDLLYLPHRGLAAPFRYEFDKPSAYVSVLCRAIDHADDDEWMARSSEESWEYLGQSDWSLANRQPASAIKLHVGSVDQQIDLWSALQGMPPTAASVGEEDSHVLRLSAKG